MERTREGLQVGDKGQAKGLRCDLVTKAQDASGRRGKPLLFLCNPSGESGLLTSGKSPNNWAQREMRVKYRLGVSNKNMPPELR